MRRGFKIWQSALRVYGTLAVSGGGGLSYAAFLRPEATHNTFKTTFVNFPAC